MNPLGSLTVKKRYPVEAIIWEMYKGDRIRHDRMRRTIDKETGHEFYQFLKSKGEYRPMPFDKIIPSDTGLTAFLASPASGQYFLVELKREYEEKDVTFARFENNKLIEQTLRIKAPVIKPINESLRQTATVLHHRTNLRFSPKKTWMEKYGALLIIIVVGIAMAMPLIFYPMYLTAVMDKLNGINSGLQGVVNNLANVMGSVHTAVPVNATT